MTDNLREVATTEVDAAHALYLEVFAWLKTKGVRQWLRALPRAEFQERQARDELFACFEGGRMAAIVTLALEADADWMQHLGPDKRWWLKSLAVARLHGGKDIGAQVIGECEKHLIGAGATEVYLECVDTGFLPRYYERLGYEVVKRATITYPSGNTFPVALMRKRLRQGAAVRVGP